MAANAGAIRAGKAYVEAMLNDTHLRRGLIAAEARLKAFAGGLSTLGTKMVAVGAAIGAPMTAAAKLWGTAGGHLVDMSQRTGIAATQLSALSYAAQQTGTDIDGFETAVKRMAKGITEAGNGGKEQIEMLGRLGTSYAELAGLSPDRQFKVLADRLSEIRDPSAKAAAAIALFGRSGTAVLPMIEGGSRGLAEFEARAARLGIVMSNETARDAKKFDDALTDLTRVAKSTAGALAAAIAPMLKEISQAMITSLTSAKLWIKTHQDLIANVLKAAAALIGVGVAFKALSGVITVTTAALKVIGFILSPAGLITTGVLAAAAGVAYLAGEFDNLKEAIYGGAAEEFERRAEAWRAAAAAAVGLTDRLQALEAAQQLGSDERGEAAAAIATLTKQYGDLGLSVDEATGKLQGLARAQAMIESINASKAASQARMDAANANAARLQAIDAANASGSKGERARLDATTKAWLAKRKAAQEADVASQRAARVLADVWEGRRSGTPSMEARAGRRGVDQDWAEGEKRKELEKKAADDLAEARLKAIDNEALRENERIQQTYAKKIEEAKGAAAAIATLEKARDMELVALGRKVDGDRMKEAARTREEAAEKAKREDEDRASARGDLEEEIARAQVEATMTGRQKEIALLEIERQKALGEARKAGIPDERVNQLFGLKAAVMGRGLKRDENVVGQFGGEAASQLGPSTTAQKIAAEAQKQSKLLTDIERWLRMIQQAGGAGLVLQ